MPAARCLSWLKWGAGAAVLAVLCGGCVPLPGAYTDSTEEDFFLRGTARFTTPEGQALSPADQAQAVALLDHLSLYSGLAYRVTYGQDYTRLESGGVWAVREDFTDDPRYYPGGHAYFGAADGSLAVSDLQCAVNVSLTEPPAGYADVALTGTFDREQAQHAIDRLRKSEDRFGYATSHERFLVHWTVTGSHNEAPFSLVLDQEFAAARVRYSTPI